MATQPPPGFLLVRPSGVGTSGAASYSSPPLGRGKHIGAARPSFDGFSDSRDVRVSLSVLRRYRGRVPPAGEDNMNKEGTTPWSTA